MAPPNPKHPRSRPPAQQAAPKRRQPTLELPFDDDEVLDADDPRPQRVAQLPAPRKAAAPPRRPPEQEAIPTTIYEISQDEELPPTYDPRDVSDPGYKPAYLYVEKGPGQGQLIPLKQGAIVVGRASIADLRLQHPSVSRRHAQLTRLGERFYLKDLGSQNATYVNKVKIETEIEVYPGDQLQIGSASLKLRGASENVGTEVKKQLEKAAAVSAKRARKNPKFEETEQRARPRASSSSGLKMGLAFAAIGFGVAVLGFVVVKALGQNEPTFQELPQKQPVAVADAPVAVEPEAPVVTAVAETRDEVNARIQREMEAKRAAATQPEPAARPEPAPKPASATQVARRDRTPPRREERKPAAAASAGAPSNAEILKLYEDGNVGAAISAAERAGDDDLAQKLTAFQTAYTAAAKAERAGDGTGAIKQYQKALAVDEKISGGWGKHGPAISKKLGTLYTLVGQYYQKEDDAKNAELAFKEALKYDPQNAAAKKALANVGSAGEQKVASRASKKNAIDDAWSDDDSGGEAEAAPAPKKTSAVQKKRSAIEDAWED